LYPFAQRIAQENCFGGHILLWLLNMTYSDFFSEQNCLGYFPHRFATVHAHLAELTKGFRFAQASLYEKTLGALDDLACLLLLAEVSYLLLQGT
jgi:hypothetical protein